MRRVILSICMAVISTGVVNGAGSKTVTIYEPGGVDVAHAGRADGEGFIDSLMSRLSLEEKIGQLNLRALKKYLYRNQV